MNPLSSARRSFIYRRLPAPEFAHQSIGDAAVAKSSKLNAERTDLNLVDLSVLPRWGLKGREALVWLEQLGVQMPAADNLAIVQRDGSLVARLSPGEALVLAPFRGECTLANKIDSLPADGSGACYPAPRRDSHCWFAVTGQRAPNMFAKLCAVDLSQDRFSNGRVAQTSVARLSAIVIRHDLHGSLAFSILADSASAEYLWDCLLDAMTEFAGVVCEIDALGVPHSAEQGNRA